MSADKLIERLPRRLKMGELRVFVAVLEHRSFRKAATALHVTQPAVTKAIAGLEDMLEVKLFDRKADGIEPTVHGLAFAPHAVAIFGELRSAAQRLAIVSSGAKGTLHIGTVPMPGVAFLPIAIKALVDDHPDIFVSVIEARESELAERLRKREIEIAILRSAMFVPGDDLHVDALASGRHAHEVTLVRPGDPRPGGNLVAACHQVLHVHVHVGEGCLLHPEEGRGARLRRGQPRRLLVLDEVVRELVAEPVDVSGVDPVIEPLRPSCVVHRSSSRDGAGQCCFDRGRRP